MSVSEADNKDLFGYRVRFFPPRDWRAVRGAASAKLGRLAPRCQTKRTISTKGRHRTRCPPARALHAHR